MSAREPAAGEVWRRASRSARCRSRLEHVGIGLGLVAACAVLGSYVTRAAAEQAGEPRAPAAGQIDAGAYHTCALLTGGTVRCWGYSGEGELGYGNTNTIGDDEAPSSVGPVDLGPGRTAVAISAGDYHTCVIRDDGSVLCWGFGGDGRLGYGNTDNVGDDETPGSVGPVDLGAGRTAVAISAGGGHTCAVLDNGSVRCWGYGFNGQLGYGNRDSIGDNETPGSVGPVSLGAGRTAVAISAGGQHTCAVLDDGSVRCWGLGLDGRLGYGNTNSIGRDVTPDAAGPVNLGTGRTATAISAGDAHTCALLDDGSVRCWGYGLDGRLGYGDQRTIGDNETPAAAGPVNLGRGRTAVAISAGGRHTCAVLDDGGVRCWGNGASGQLGYASTSPIGDNETPDSVGPVDLGTGRTATAISAGYQHTCARLDDDSVRCWGDGANGRLGYCNETNVGDVQTPGSTGPVNLIPGDSGVLCSVTAAAPVNVSLPSISGSAISGETLTESHGTWWPIPTGFRYQWERCDVAGANCATIAGAGAQTYALAATDVGSTIRVLETATNGATTASTASAPTAIIKAAPLSDKDSVRTRAWRNCLAKVSAGARHLRALTHRGSERRRAEAHRRLTRRLARGRRRCVTIWGRIPGRITGLQTIARGDMKIELDFAAPGTDGSQPPAATSYLVKQFSHPIRDQRDFATAQALCRGACRFTVTSIGSKIALTITALQPHTTYYYAIAALDNVSGRAGPRSKTVMGRTL